MSTKTIADGNEESTPTNLDLAKLDNTALEAEVIARYNTVLGYAIKTAEGLYFLGEAFTVLKARYRGTWCSWQEAQGLPRSTVNQSVQVYTKANKLGGVEAIRGLKKHEVKVALGILKATEPKATPTAPAETKTTPKTKEEPTPALTPTQPPVTTQEEKKEADIIELLSELNDVATAICDRVEAGDWEGKSSLVRNSLGMALELLTKAHSMIPATQPHVHRKKKTA